ncbi:MAG TPA: carboxypeptidase-like regulatory domain-containing protein [Terracidiphilus sp.]|nr:carboxypeptidase-like regulatory domain-containing protein [Terracidiphilus sp.]
MKLQRLLRVLGSIAAVVVLTALAATGRAQSGSQGTIVVTVQDASGGVVQGASLELIDLSTNDVRQAATRENGEYTFVNLSIGAYKLSATHQGYETTVMEHVEVHAAQTTDLRVELAVGAQAVSVEVKGNATPLLEFSSNAVGTVVDLKQIEDLPLTGRDLTALATLTPGYSGANGMGEWNGQPLISQGSNIDGTVGESSRMKIFGNVEPAVTPRIEDIAEMTVQTDQLDLDQGFGQTVMQANFVTRRGSNKFHGRVFENFHNDGLNANSWTNDETGQHKAKVIFNDFGGSADGPILRDKLFFFGSFATQRVPGGYTASQNGVLSPAAQAGNFTYTGTDGNPYTVNVLSVAHGYLSSLPGTVNSLVAAQLNAINGSLSSGTQAPGSDPNLDSLYWNNANSTAVYFPSVRVDFNASEKLRMNLSWTMTDTFQPGASAAPYPGSGFANMVAGNKYKNYTASYGVDWTVSPQLVNQFKAGFLYDVSAFAYNAAPLYAAGPSVNWALGSSGQSYQLPVTSYYPAFNLTDTVTWQKSSHTLKAGFTGYREQDHYWNPPSGFPVYQLGLASGDPAINAFTNSTGESCSSSGILPCASNNSLGEAQNLYATLAGRISGVGGSYAYNAGYNGYKPAVGSYALDEVSLAWGLFAQDSWRVFPSLTLNYGLRWDFTGESTDKTGLYHSADPSSVYGPTAQADLFKPGALAGNSNPTLVARSQAYAPYHVTPQPALGLAWNPKGLEGVLGKLAGDGKTVVRAGYSLRRFTEPYQYYWNNVSDQGSFYYQSFNLYANNTGAAGSFSPGSLALGSTLPAYVLSPASYQAVAPESEYTFYDCGPGCGPPGVTGIDPHIPQPYTQTWNLGIQRQIGTRALEIRYSGNRTIHQWVNHNTNEVNVFENGFLDEFKKAQANLAAYTTANPNCGQNGTCSFANNGLAGQSALPIFDAAFAGEASGGPGAPAIDYINSTFVTDLDSGQVGAIANTFAGINGTTGYFCNLVGSGFAPCVNNAGYSGGAGNYPINFFQANPYAAGVETQYMVAAGYSNYESLQVDLRQQQWAGLQFDANYTLSHTLGFQVNTNGTAASGYACGYYGYSGWCGWPGTLTLRNLSLAYGPTQFDIRQVLHLSGTYDLPIGKGKALLNGDSLASRMLGNWTVGTILTFQTGTPQQIIGNNLTYNDYGDGGVRLNNVTVGQLQRSVGVRRVPGKTYALLLDPKYLAAPDGSGGANTSYIAPNTTPGTIVHPIYLHGPHAFYNDISLSKAFPLWENFRFKLQAEATNAWNHPVFGSTSGAFASDVQNSGFATAGITNGARVIEFRANIEF